MTYFGNVARNALAAGAFILVLAAPVLAQVDSETVLYSFTGGTDGALPLGGLLSDSRGNLYGTTSAGGSASGGGTIFQLSPPNNSGAPWTESTLYRFCSGGGLCTDGKNPGTSLIFDSLGNLYGTAAGGSENSGIVFELSPPSSGSGAWAETVLYNFCSAAGEFCPDGSSPVGSLALDSQGNLYGAASTGGGAGGYGLLFELSPPAGGSSGPWSEKVLYGFCLVNDDCPDGSSPHAGLIIDSKGNLFGTTYQGGQYNGGEVFKLTPPAGGSGAWTENVIFSFDGESDGGLPDANLVMDSGGNIYSTTVYGTAAYCAGCGVAFEISPPASGSGPWTETNFYDFCSLANCADGTGPVGGLIVDASGKVYGTTGGSGPADAPGPGLFFALAPSSGATGSWSERVLYSFCTATTCTSGLGPNGSLIFDSAGNLYGTTVEGGPDGEGIVFELAPNTATSVSSNLNPSIVDEPVTLTATVSGGSAPTGTVGFTSNATAISGCSATTLLSRQAQCVTSTLPIGSDVIVATYSGDSSNAASNGSWTQIVTLPAAATTLISSLNPSTLGDSVTFTATVSASGPPNPTGTVGFASLGTTLSGCSAVVLSDSQTVTCTTSTLPVGTDAIVATYSGDSDYSGSSGTFAQLVNPIPMAVQFVPVTPCRVVDTRNADGPFGGPEIAIGTSRSFAIPVGPCAGIPGTATAYSLNVTVVPPGPLGYVTIWPTGEGQPTVSTLNSLDGRTKANAAIVPAGTSGAVTVYANNTTNVVLDINGYFETGSSSSLKYYPLTPCRVADTRKAAGPLGGPSLVAATERDFPIMSSSCGIPGGAQVYSLNFTVVPPSGEDLGYLTVWPEGQSRPLVSTLNDPTGTIVANAALVLAGTGGGVAVYPSGATDLVIDVNGYFAAAGTGGLQLYTLTPCRVLDTRKTTGAFSDELTVNVASSPCAPPSTAQAYVFNATVVPSGDLGYLTLWPDGETQPVVSTLNAEDGVITSNMAIVPNKDGKADAYASGTTQLVLDISAYFAP